MVKQSNLLLNTLNKKLIWKNNLLKELLQKHKVVNAKKRSFAEL